MAETPDIRPVGDLPNEMGKTAPRELHSAGISSLAEAAAHTEQELLSIHGVGPKSIRILKAALAQKGMSIRDPS